jgi:hypothetical protein
MKISSAFYRLGFREALKKHLSFIIFAKWWMWLTMGISKGIHH